MPGKKWCEYCRINLPYDKKAIQDHESTRLHTQNKQKHIKFERIKIQRQEKAKREAVKANGFTSTANIPKAKKGSQLEKQVQSYRNDVIMNGKMAIHQLIAEKTQGLYGAPIQYPEKEDLVLAENYQDEKDGGSQEENNLNEQKFQMWKIDICQETGKACFINRISKAKIYEPPKGYIMSQQQKQEWQFTKKLCQQTHDENLQKQGIAGQWEQVSEEDYFQKNRAQQDEQQNQSEQKQEQNIKYQFPNPQIKKQYPDEQQHEYKVKKQQPAQIRSWVDQLQQRVHRNQLTQSQVISTILTNTLDECKTVKEKNQALKKLVKRDFQILATLKNDDQELLRLEQKGQNKVIGIKPRKRVKTQQLLQQKDMV